MAQEGERVARCDSAGSDRLYHGSRIFALHMRTSCASTLGGQLQQARIYSSILCISRIIPAASFTRNSCSCIRELYKSIHCMHTNIATFCFRARTVTALHLRKRSVDPALATLQKCFTGRKLKGKDGRFGCRQFLLPPTSRCHLQD